MLKYPCRIKFTVFTADLLTFHVVTMYTIIPHTFVLKEPTGWKMYMQDLKENLSLFVGFFLRKYESSHNFAPMYATFQLDILKSSSIKPSS